MKDHWADGMRSLHGLAVNHFPNMFLMGPGQAGFTANYPHLLDEQAEEVVLPNGELRQFPTASCPHCDAAVEERWQACPSCGGSLSDEAAADAPSSAPDPDGGVLEARPVSMDELLSSLKDDEDTDDGDSGASEGGDVMDTLRKKLESLNED